MKPNAFNRLADLVMPPGWGGGFTAETEEQIDKGMGKLGTWDVLHLEGGKQITGDYRSGPSVSFISRKTLSNPIN